MATEVTDPFTELALVVEDVVLTEFDDEPYIRFVRDRLHESLGSDGNVYVGLSPNDDNADNIDMRMEMLLQFYDTYNLEIDPRQHVDPTRATNKAERLRRALADVRTTGSPHLWFFDVIRTSYPQDPTGNKSRFEMTINAWGNNTGLIETIG
jgi:hypothetical protein